MSSLMTTSEIASMRSDLEGLSLPDSAVIERPAFTDDGGGGGTTTWAAAGTVACRVSPMAGLGRDPGGETGDRLDESARWILTLPAETDVDTDDRLRVGSRTFNVLAVRAPRSFEVSRRVETNELT